MMRSLNLGDVEVIHINGGFFRLDGGTMFGVVPKTMWKKQIACDSRNRIRLACNCLLLRTPDVLALVDTGFGTRFDSQSRDIYGIEDTTIHDSLTEAGIAPEDIDLIVFTHLHFDHLAGSLHEVEGTLQATFPHATHCVQRGEWRDACDGRSTMRSSYRPTDLDALKSRVKLNLLYGDSELTPHISTFLTGGHTEWHQGVVVTGRERRLIFPGDLLPTRTHLRTFWNMAYDLFPLQTIEQKKQCIRDTIRNDWIIAWDHDPEQPWSRLEKVGDHIVARDV